MPNAVDSLGTLLFGKNAKKVYGRTPIVPTLKTLKEAQTEALAANKSNFADIAAMATDYNRLSQEQLDMLTDLTLGPGVREQFQKNLAAGARGEIPDDVLREVYRTEAERNTGGNAFGGGFLTNKRLRNVIGTSYDLTQRALSSAEQWLASSRAPMLDYFKAFGISTEQQYAANIDQFNRNWLAEKVAAAPDPAYRGVFDSNMALAGMILSAYSGGAGYQGAYKPQQDQQFASAVAPAQSYYMPQSYQSPYAAPYNSNGSYPYSGGGLPQESDTALAFGGGRGGGGLAAMFA